jgi:ankyrin repeat protein
MSAEPLLQAAEGGDYERISVLLEAKADVNAMDASTNWTLLHYAALCGHDTCVRVLVEAKADVNATDVGGWTPLHYAALRGHDTCFRVLLEGKADVNAMNARGRTPLFVSALRGHDTCVLVLLEAKADVNAVNARGETLLFRLLLDPGSGGTTRSRISTAALLLEHDIDLSLQDEYGTTIVEAIKRPVLQISVEVRESPVWQLIQASERAALQRRSSSKLSGYPLSASN